MPITDHTDITRRINLADPDAVCAEICRLLRDVDPALDQVLIERAFAIFARLYAGTLPGYHGCETLYHDMQHALDVTLTCARLLAGHERAHAAPDQRFGAARLTLGVVVALFHDCGYIRQRPDDTCWHGAQYTLYHVSRGGRFLTRFLIESSKAQWARRAMKLIHFTGYEIPIANIRLSDPLDRRLGSLIGSADLMAQMADRTYLEKCRDYLFEEFELGGLSRKRHADGSTEVIYTSPEDLLRKTPAFYDNMVKKRLDIDFERGYRYLEALFDGDNPYLQAIDRNMDYLQRLLDDGQLANCLRRQTEPVLAPKA
ncbi:MAG: hypothetical protein JSS58_05215 [Proteobacteria bacterium]|nr:hypothetical protein [Pseudomonadota bacterium]